MVNTVLPDLPYQSISQQCSSLFREFLWIQVLDRCLAVAFTALIVAYGYVIKV